LQPIIVTDRGQVRFWCGTAALDAKRLAHSYELLRKDASRVFPVRFESEVELGRRSGQRQRAGFPGAGGFSDSENQDSCVMLYWSWFARSVR
jgi:hypothetical protein